MIGGNKQDNPVDPCPPAKARSFLMVSDFPIIEFTGLEYIDDPSEQQLEVWLRGVVGAGPVAAASP